MRTEHRYIVSAVSVDANPGKRLSNIILPESRNIGTAVCLGNYDEQMIMKL